MTLSNIPDNETLNFVFDMSILKIQKYPNIKLKFPNNIIKKKSENYHYILSSMFYKGGIGLDVLSIQMKDNIEYLAILKNFVDSISEKYDYIIIDCPPSNNLITQSAFLMSDYYLIPTILDTISTNGVIHYIKTISKIYKKNCVENEDAMLSKLYFGDEPKLLGIFYNLIRKQVTYDTEKVKFNSQIKKFDETNKIHKIKSIIEAEERKQIARLSDERIQEIKNEVQKTFLPTQIFDMEINNYIDISRATQQMIYRQDFDSLFNKIIKIVE